MSKLREVAVEQARGFRQQSGAGPRTVAVPADPATVPDDACRTAIEALHRLDEKRSVIEAEVRRLTGEEFHLLSKWNDQVAAAERADEDAAVDALKRGAKEPEPTVPAVREAAGKAIQAHRDAIERAKAQGELVWRALASAEQDFGKAVANADTWRRSVTGKRTAALIAANKALETARAALAEFDSAVELGGLIGVPNDSQPAGFSDLRAAVRKTAPVLKGSAALKGSK